MVKNTKSQSKELKYRKISLPCLSKKQLKNKTNTNIDKVSCKTMLSKFQQGKIPVSLCFSKNQWINQNNLYTQQKHMVHIPTTCNLHVNNFDNAYPWVSSRSLPSFRPAKTTTLCVSSPVGYSAPGEEPSESSEHRLISAAKGDNLSLKMQNQKQKLYRFC